MPDTYTQLRYHLVFSTKHRMPLISTTIRDDLYDYMGGVLRARGGLLLSAGGMPDHVHLLAGWGTTASVAEMMKHVKGISSRWMNERSDSPVGGFAWQEGYGAFSVSVSQVAVVQKYILTQEEHHKKVSFQEEYMGLLKKHGIDFNPLDFNEEGHPDSPVRDGRW